MCRRLTTGPPSRHWRDPQAGPAKRCKGPLRCDEPRKLLPVNQALPAADWRLRCSAFNNAIPDCPCPRPRLQPFRNHGCPINTQCSLLPPPLPPCRSIKSHIRASSSCSRDQLQVRLRCSAIRVHCYWLVSSDLVCPSALIMAVVGDNLKWPWRHLQTNPSDPARAWPDLA